MGLIRAQFPALGQNDEDNLFEIQWLGGISVVQSDAVRPWLQRARVGMVQFSIFMAHILSRDWIKCVSIIVVPEETGGLRPINPKDVIQQGISLFDLVIFITDNILHTKVANGPD